MPKGTPGQRKVGFTFPVELVERLNEAKWELRKNKAEIVIEAVEEYLDRRGIKKVKEPSPEPQRMRPWIPPEQTKDTVDAPLLAEEHLEAIEERDGNGDRQQDRASIEGTAPPEELLQQEHLASAIDETAEHEEACENKQMGERP